MKSRKFAGRLLPQAVAFEVLEPYDGKLSCMVLRGESGGNARDLPGLKKVLNV